MTLAEKIYPGITQKDKALEGVFPFDSERKMMSIMTNGEVYVKGSPDHILSHCTHIQDGDDIRPMTEDDLKKIKEHYAHMAEQALRVLGFGYKKYETLPKSEEEAEDNLIYM